MSDATTTSATAINLGKLRDQLANAIQTDGARLKRDLMKLLRALVKTEGWKQFEDPATGRPFENIERFLRARYPSGAGCGQFHDMLSYGDVVHLCRGDSKLLTILIENVKAIS